MTIGREKAGSSKGGVRVGGRFAPEGKRPPAATAALDGGDAAGLPRLGYLDAARAANVHGRLNGDARRRLDDLLDSPGQQTWDDAYTLVVSGRGFTTLWQAVLAVDPAFPRAKADPGRWPRVPDRETLLAALRHAADLEAAPARPAAPARTARGAGRYETTTGSRYTGPRRAADVARDVRADIKAAVASGELPPGPHYSVTAQTYSGGQSVNIAAKGMAYDEIHGCLRADGHRGKGYSAATRRMLGTLRALGEAYDQSTSDPSTDHHSGNHFTWATVETPAQAASLRMGKARAARDKGLAAAANTLRPTAAKTGVPTRALLAADATGDPRLAGLGDGERFALIVAQEDAAGLAAAHAEAKRRYTMLRAEEDDLRD